MLVAQPDPTDVAGLGVELLAQVEPPEDQALVGRVELGDPAGGLEDHGVTLDEPALVAERAAAVALARQGLRRRGGALQLHVDAVHDRLLVCDLACGELVGHPGPCFPVKFPVEPRSGKSSSLQGAGDVARTDSPTSTEEMPDPTPWSPASSRPLEALSTPPGAPRAGGLDNRSLALAARPPHVTAGQVVEPTRGPRQPLAGARCSTTSRATTRWSSRPSPGRTPTEVSTTARWRSVLDHRRRVGQSARA